MHIHARGSALTLFVFAASAILLSQTTTRPPAPVPPVRAASAAADILWDRWGVPHIFAASPADAFYAFGFAQMESHGDLMLRLYGQARGRGAEYWGHDYLETDKYVRTMGVPARARAWAAQQTPAFRPLLDAFVAGVNDYARQHADRLHRDVQVVLPIDASDVLAHVQRVLNFTFVSNPQLIQGQADRWNRGSNTWAVAPARTADGHALLLANPHLPWSDLFTWYEAQISTGSVNAYGATLVGSPMLAIAFNDVLGWSHTNNTMDGSDVYDLELADGGYRWNGAVRPFDASTETLKIKQPDGSLKDEALTIRRSVHGPVVADKPGHALAVRVVGLDAPNVGDQYWQMITARTLDEFQAAERPLQNPFFTVMYADRAGHIMHLFGGRTPARPAGNFDWSGIVPGTSDATLWTATHPYDALPKVIDPPSGWLQNANDPPWTTTFPSAIDPNRYPSYMAPRGPMSLRAQRSAELLDSNPSFTLDTFIAAKHSTRLALADRVLGDLLAAVKTAEGATNGGTPSAAAAAAGVLDTWDRSADADSRGAVLFESWYRRFARSGSVFANRWADTSPRTTPSGLRDAIAAVAALAAAADDVQKTYGRLDVAWGDVYRLRVGTHDLPANGGGGELGIFRVLNFAKDPKDGRMIAAGGDSYVAAIEFGPAVRARSLIAYGNASQPGSPHIGDQLELFAKKQLKPVWRTRQDVEANLEKKETVRNAGGGR
jgi:acyl-homoserine-lactone acylase